MAPMRWLVAGIAAISLFAGPAATAGDSQVAEGGCAIQPIRNPHVLVDPNPNKIFAVAWSDPHAVVGTGFYAGVPGTDIIIHCAWRVNSTQVVTLASEPGTGVAFVAPTSVSFAAGMADDLYQCTSITWTDPDGTPQSRDMGCSGPYDPGTGLGK